jgi:hypothetical protein
MRTGSLTYSAQGSFRSKQGSRKEPYGWGWIESFPSFSLEQSRALPSLSFQRWGLHQSSLSELFFFLPPIAMQGGHAR